METINLFMPLLAELGGFGGGLCYKRVAPDGALALQRHPFHKATEIAIPSDRAFDPATVNDSCC